MAAILKVGKSPYLSNGLTDRYKKMMHIIDPLHPIGRVSWRHSNLWSWYNLHVVGDLVVL